MCWWLISCQKRYGGLPGRLGGYSQWAMAASAASNVSRFAGVRKEGEDRRRRDAGRGCLLISGWRYPRSNFGRGRLLFGKYDRPEGAGMRRAMDGVGKRWIRTKKRPPIEDRSRCGGRCDADDDDDVVVVVVLLLLCALLLALGVLREMCNDFSSSSFSSGGQVVTVFLIQASSFNWISKTK